MRVEQIESDGLEQAVRLSALRVVTLASLVFEITKDSRRRALGLVSHFTSDWSLREAASDSQPPRRAAPARRHASASPDQLL
jgi:hypothetical protein